MPEMNSETHETWLITEGQLRKNLTLLSEKENIEESVLGEQDWKFRLTEK